MQIPIMFIHKGGIDYVVIGSYNGLAPNRRQAIIWTKCWLRLLDKYMYTYMYI